MTFRCGFEPFAAKARQMPASEKYGTRLTGVI